MPIDENTRPEDIPIDDALPRIDYPVMRRSPNPRPGANPYRVISGIIGVLLIVMGIIAPVLPSERINAAVAGLFVLGLSLGALRFPTLRWFNVVVAVWLITSGVGLAPGGSVFGSLVGVSAAIIFVMSLVPGPSEAHPPRPREAA